LGEDSQGRELSLGELFQKTFELFRKNYTAVIPIFALLGIVSTLLSSAITLSTPTPSIPANFANLTTSQMTSELGSISQYLGYTLSNYFVSWCVLYFAAAVGIWRMNKAVKRSSEKGPNYTSLAVTTILSVLLIEAGAFLLVVGALILATMLYLVLPSAALEGKSAFAAMQRSRQLVSGRWFKTFFLLAGVQIVIAVFANLVGAFAGLPFSGETSTIAVTIASNFITALSFPLVSASMLALYYSNLSKQKQYVPKPPSIYDNMKSQPIPGFPISQHDSCPKCGVSVTQEERFCHNCGMPLQP
jgi:multisubunit Na+/H+ antiporter MnhG subunit